MGKYVYLFELDSVRKTDEEIVKAQQTLYDEIVGNGNTVVMTYNQVVDSRGFFCLLHNNEYYDNIIKLFQNGKIKISQYGDTRTLSQYLLNSLDTEKEFIYSALPVKNNQKRLLALMRRSLMYADLSEIYEYGKFGHRSEEELKDLFIELNEYSDENEKILCREESSTLSIIEMRDILGNLYWLLSYVLKLSPMHDIYLSPKDTSEYQGLKIYDYISAAENIPNADSLLKQAIKIVVSLSAYKEKNENRSVYLREIKEQWESTNKINTEIYQRAEAIINQCYNYACEASICNISKHYNIDEILSATDDKPTFYKDFILRLNEDWNGGKASGIRFLVDETNTFSPFNNWHKMPSFKQAVRMTDYVSKRTDKNIDAVYRYEYESTKQRKKNKNGVAKSITVKILFSFLCVVIACILELFFNNIQDLVEDHFIITGWLYTGLETILFLFITELLTTGIQKFFPSFISLSEAIGGIFTLLKDAFCIAKLKVTAHTNTCAQYVEKTETISAKIPIDFVKTKEMKKYIKLRKNAIKSDSLLFRDSDIISLCDVDDDNVVKALLRKEEIYNQRYGVIYQSKFNKLLVDPVKCNGISFPYERMTPASGYDGVVMVAKYSNNYILLNQFRHALREKQYSFPRGFAESANPVDDAVRELKEELHAQTKGEPYYLGRIAPDSGLTTTRAYVYCVDIESYSTSEGHEGIVNAVEVPCGEFEQWIKENRIDDGYTLGAYMLLKTKMSTAVS